MSLETSDLVDKGAIQHTYPLVPRDCNRSEGKVASDRFCDLNRNKVGCLLPRPECIFILTTLSTPLPASVPSVVYWYSMLALATGVSIKLGLYFHVYPPHPSSLSRPTKCSC